MVIKREIFNSSIPIDLRFSQETQDQRDDRVKTLYNNTKQFMLNNGVLIPVKLGHDDTNPYLKGHLESIDLEKINGYTSIIGTFYVDDDVMIEKLPGVSIEFVEQGYINGDVFGQHITAVSFQGSSPVAYPLLHKFSAQYQVKETNIMPERDAIIQAFMDKIIEKLPIILGEVIDGILGQAEPNPQMEVMQKELQEFRNQAATQAFELLVAKKQIVNTENKKKVFMELAKEKGVKFASEALSNDPINIPKGEIVPGAGDSKVAGAFSHLQSILKSNKAGK